MRTVEDRLQALERQLSRTKTVNRTLGFALIAVVCITGAQTAGRPPAPEQKPTTSGQQTRELPAEPAPAEGSGLREVKTQRLVLVDKLGRSRAQLEVIGAGPVLSMLDEQGHKKLELGDFRQRSGLHLFDPQGRPVASLRGADNRGEASLEFRSSQGSISTNASGITIKDQDDNQRALFALINGDFPVLGISQTGQAGPPSVEITAGEDGSRRLNIHDVAGRALFSVSATRDAATTLSMNHPNHAGILQISAGANDTAGPSIAFHAPANSDGSGGLLPFIGLGLGAEYRPYLRIVDRQGSPLFHVPTEVSEATAQP